jgi:AraC-like DNA-binding protein
VRSIVALLHDRASRARLTDALRGRAGITFCATAPELLAAIAAHPAYAAVVELSAGEAPSAAPLIRTVRDRFPSVPVLAYCGALTPGTAREIHHAARAGARELVLRGEDEGARIRAAVARAEGDSLAALVDRRLAPLVPGDARAVFRQALLRADRPIPVTALARRLGVHRKTLAGRLARGGHPAPSRIVGWCRLLVAARRLEDPRRSVERVAAELGFASGAALRNMLRRYTGLRPADVRAAGGVEPVLRALERSLERALLCAAGDADRTG